ncbi:MAG TPA: hypothetical protein VN797_02720 [Gemmatimonadaceae bacterium]|jgi:hypothetical protein|nr:hypothetical protein [Gemmatimonadaceae bacterium]
MTLCTGLTASWCPRCGDCTCERGHDGDCCFDGADCPLHRPESKHAETVELGQAEALVKSMAAEQGITLTEHDDRVVSRFAQYLLERSRKGPELSPEAQRLRKEILG